MTASKAKKPSKKCPAKPEPLTVSAAAPVLRTEGQRLLLAVDGSHTTVAARIGATKQSVSYWRRGEKAPGPKARAALLEAYGIEPAAWEAQPGSPPPQSSTRSKRTRAPSPPPKVPGRPSGASTLDEVEVQLGILRELQRNESLLPSERVRLADSVGKLLAIRARLERDQELLEERIVLEHPFWGRLKSTIVRALEPYPEAARAVADALGAAGA